MKIGYDAKRAFHNSSGLGNYSRELMRIMFRYHEQNEYFLFNPKPPKRHLYHFEETSLRHEVRPQSQLHRLVHPLWRSKAIIGECKKRGIDLYHGLSNELPIGIAKSGVRAIVSVHDLIFMRFPKLYRKADRIIYKAKFEQACREADKIIAISEQTAQDIQKFLQVKANKIEVVYQGCMPEFSARYTKNQLEKTRTYYKLPERFILSLGTLERRKNQELIIRALAQMKEPIPLVLIGKPTSYKNHLIALAKALNVDKHLVFLSDLPVADLARAIQLAELSVYPSLFEGFGIPIIEAMASGTPVISSKGSCFHEVGGEAAVYIETSDHLALAHEINQMLHDEKARNQRIELGFKQFEKFSEDKIAERLKQVYGC